MKVCSAACHLVSVALLTISVGSKAEASFLVNISQSGSDVVASGSGTINTDGLTLMSSGPGGSLIYPALSLLAVGDPTAAADAYVGVMAGPDGFGPGGPSEASSGEGNVVAFALLADPPNGLMAVPFGYVSGSALSDNSTWEGTTITDLGLTPGSYVYSWGSGETADSLTLDIEEGSSTPEPGTLCLLGVGGIGLVLHRLRKRVVRGQQPHYHPGVTLRATG